LHASNCIHERVVAWQARVFDLLVGFECQEENRPFSGQQHQAQFGLKLALGSTAKLLLFLVCKLRAAILQPES